ncbi:MAG: hypothetical protein MI799_05555 [Desulfobacterales bacterium]|nr:hypothetical protein [Desulfobacterales bacterium]
MLRIRESQYRVLEAYQRRRFAKETAEHLLRDFPEKCGKLGLDAGNVVAFTEKGLDRARNLYELICSDDLRFFAECTVMLHPEFDLNDNVPWACTIMSDDSLTGSEKIAQIDESLLFEGTEPL